MTLTRERSDTKATHKVKSSDGDLPRKYFGLVDVNVRQMLPRNQALLVRWQYTGDLIVRACHKSIMRTSKVINCGVKQAAMAIREIAYSARARYLEIAFIIRRQRPLVSGVGRRDGEVFID
ncbi:hypothetical protein LSAT2_011988 [Lamellibrachia satsuma]|nr:hypothetical protein LSAT2_011988 [Lamellibrachia satsuma]